MNEIHRTTPFFYAAPTDIARDEEFYQLKAMVYFHLNVFEEIFLTTEGAGVIAKQFERPGWNEYIFRKMRHPLIREVFDREAEKIYSGEFTKFIKKHRNQIEEAPDPGPF